MKKTVCIGLCFLVVLMCGAIARAGDDGGLYLAIKGGGGLMRGDVSMDNNQTSTLTDQDTHWRGSVFTYGGAVGWDWMDQGLPLRTELEYFNHGSLTYTSWDSNATFSTSMDIETYQMNFYYDFYTKTRFTPFLGAGVGMAQIDASSGSQTNFSYSLFGGAACRITDSILIDFTYRINQYGDVPFEWHDEDNQYSGKIKNVNSVEGIIGLRYEF